MENYASGAWSEIIAKAAVSPLGIAALVLLIVGFVVVTLIKPSDKPHFRLTSVIILMVFCGALMGASIYAARPSALPHVAVTEAQSEGPSQQPPQSATVAAPGSEATSSAPIAEAAARQDCGTAWSGWTDVGGAVGNPCPGGCERGSELGQSYRVVGFPPRPQTKHKFQCWR